MPEVKETTDERPRPKTYGSPAEARLQHLKENLVIELLLDQGRFWEAVKKVRTRWQIEPATELPRESEGILYPPGVEELINSEEPYAAYTDLKKRLRGDPHEVALLRRDLYNGLRYVQPPGDPKELHAVCRNLELCWHSDLGWVLLHGISEKYLEDRPSHYGTPPFSEYRLPWYRFAAACVLHNPPPEKDLSPLVEYGGFPLLSGGAKTQEGPVLGVVSGRELQEREIQREIWREFNEMVFEKMWKLYSELNEPDPEAAKRAFYQRYLTEIAEIEEGSERRVRERYAFDAEARSWRDRIEIDVETVASPEVERMLDAVRAREGHNPRGGRPPAGTKLLEVQCAFLLYHRNSVESDRRRRRWTHEKLAKNFGLGSANVAEDRAKAGQEEILRIKSLINPNY